MDGDTDLDYVTDPPPPCKSITSGTVPLVADRTSSGTYVHLVGLAESRALSFSDRAYVLNV